jgi:hypothetical protein
MALGAVFFLFYQPIFDVLDVESPNNTSYIHLTAAYVFVQGLGYWIVSRNPWQNAGLVQVGVVYKAIYIAVALYYVAIDELIASVFAWFALGDLAFLLFFVRFLMVAKDRTTESVAG